MSPELLFTYIFEAGLAIAIGVGLVRFAWKIFE